MSHDFKARTNNTFKFSVIYYTDETETTPVNLTSYTVDMDIKDSAGTTVATGVATKATPNTLGQIDVVVPFGTTATWPVGTLVYDLQVILGAEKFSILDGNIFVSQGVTS